MAVGNYCRRDPQIAHPRESLRDAAQRMDVAGVGCLIVVDDERRPIGMITDRDIALRVIRNGLDADERRVEDIMLAPVVSVTERAMIGVATRFMSEHGMRRLPVVDPESGKLSGILAADDLLQLLSSEFAGVAEVARAQFPADLAGEHALEPGGARG